MDADREAPPLEQRERGEDRRDRPAGDRDELVDGRTAKDELASDPAGRLAHIGSASRPPRPGHRARPGRSARPRSSISCGMPATIRVRSGNSRRNARQPAEAGASMGPGTRKQSRPCSSAHDAVISAPLRAGASTTTVASARPLMTRLRRGNVPRLGADVGRQLGHDRAAGRDDRHREPAVGTRVEDGRGRSR